MTYYKLAPMKWRQSDVSWSIMTSSHTSCRVTWTWLWNVDKFKIYKKNRSDPLWIFTLWSKWKKSSIIASSFVDENRASLRFDLINLANSEYSSKEIVTMLLQQWNRNRLDSTASNLIARCTADRNGDIHCTWYICPYRIWSLSNTESILHSK